MTSERWQFRLWHLIMAVVFSAVILTFARAVTANPSRFGINVGLVLLGNNAAMFVFRLVDRGHRPMTDHSGLLMVWRNLGWIAVVVITVVLLLLTTADPRFAAFNGLWFGTGYFWCGLLLYEVCRPYLV